MTVESTTSKPDVPSVWDVIHHRLGSMVSQALNQADTALPNGEGTIDGLRQQITYFLHSPLERIASWHRNTGLGTPSVNEEIDGAVSEAVDKAVISVNLTGFALNISEFKEQVVQILDREIEIDVFNKVIANATRTTPQGKEDFFHNLSFRDETLFVILLCMGTVLPIIILTLSLIYFMKRKRENRERSREMLLQNQAEFSLEEYSADQTDERPKRQVEVPDLVLKDFTE